MPGAVRADAEFSKCVSLAEDELAVAEEACKFGRFAAADESLNRVESALDALRKARFAREQAERKAKEEAERVARERAESERKAREEAERVAREKAEAERKAREEKERIEREKAEAERKAREEKERIEREKVEAQQKALDKIMRNVLVAFIALMMIAIGADSCVNTLYPAGDLEDVNEGSQIQSAVGANGGLETAAPLAGTSTVVRVGSQEIALRWCPPGSFLKTQCEGPGRLALRAPDRGAVGIRLPGGDDRRVWRERQPRRDGMVFRQ